MNMYRAPQAPVDQDNQEFQGPAGGSLETALSGQYKLGISDTIQEAWALVKGNKLAIWLGVLILGAIGVVLQLLAMAIVGTDDPESRKVSLLVNLLSLPVISISSGFMMMVLKRIRGENVGVSVMFSYFPRTLPLILMSLLAWVVLVVSFLMLILPGIFLSVALSFTIFLMLDREMSVVNAMLTSVKIIAKKWFSFFFIGFFICMLNVVACIPLCIGLIWSIPLCMVCYAYTYHKVCGQE